MAARPARSGGRAQEREQAILDAALELVAEVGFDCMSMDAVATRARASKATIYRHWGGKDELVVAALRCRQDLGGDPPDTGSLRGDLLAMVDRLAESMSGTDGRIFASLIAARERDPQLAQLLRDGMYDAKRHLLRTIVDRSAARGELPGATETDAVLEVLAGAAFMQLLVLGLPLDDAWQAHVVDDVLLPLLGARRPGDEAHLTA